MAVDLILVKRKGTRYVEITRLRTDEKVGVEHGETRRSDEKGVKDHM